MLKKYNIIKCRKSNSTIIYRVRASENITREETKLGEIYAPSLYDASRKMEELLEFAVKGVWSTTGRIE